MCSPKARLLGVGHFWSLAKCRVFFTSHLKAPHPPIRAPLTKGHFKIELCERLSALRLFYVGHVVQIMRDSLSFAWNECLSCESKNTKHFLLWARIVVTTSNKKLHFVKNCTKKACSTIILPHSTNQIIGFLRWRRYFFSLFSQLDRFLVRSDSEKRSASYATGMQTRKCHGYGGQQQQHFCAF